MKAIVREALETLSEGTLLDEIFNRAEVAIFKEFKDGIATDGSTVERTTAGYKLDVLSLVKTEFKKLIGEVVRERGSRSDD